MKTKVTMSDVRFANESWFSRSNKRFFGDLDYRLLTGKTSKNKFLVRASNGWTDMFGQPKSVFYAINPIDPETLKIESMLTDTSGQNVRFLSLESVKEFLREM